MASIVTKQRDSGLVYYIAYRVPTDNGKRKQIWVRCDNQKHAYILLNDIKEAEKAGRKYIHPIKQHSYIPAPVAPGNMTVSELLEKYVQLYGKKSWGASTLHTNQATIENYINPYIGNVSVATITPRFIQEFYNDLPKHKAKQIRFRKTEPTNISARTCKEVHKILRPAFDMAQVWGEVVINPTLPVKLPKQQKYNREQWSEEEVEQAISLCDNELLRLSICLMFGCTLRSGELSGITWDCVDITDKSLANNTASIRIDKTLRRLYKEDIEATNARDIIKVFPNVMGGNKTVMVLKKPKTDTSNRLIFMSNTVAKLLVEHNKIQEQQKAELGSNYHDYNLVISQVNGNPYDVKDIAKHFKRFVKQNRLREVDFYSLRHAGSTAKLRASGNLKAVQGDMGHASAEMLTKVYATIVDEDRRNNAVLMEEKVFSKVGNFSKEISDNLTSDETKRN